MKILFLSFYTIATLAFSSPPELPALKGVVFLNILERTPFSFHSGKIESCIERVTHWLTTYDCELKENAVFKIKNESIVLNSLFIYKKHHSANDSSQLEFKYRGMISWSEGIYRGESPIIVDFYYNESTPNKILGSINIKDQEVVNGLEAFR